MSRWPLVALGNVLTRHHEMAAPDPETAYHEVTVRLWGKGLISRGLVQGSEIISPRRYIRAGQLLISKIDARSGALGIVPQELDGALVSNDFPSYAADESKLLPCYLGWLVRTDRFVRFCQSASEGTTNRIRLQEQRLLENLIALPPLLDQKRIVSELDWLATKANQLAERWQSIEHDVDALLAREFADVIAGAPYRALGEVAPLVRREASIREDGNYPELGIRSFGKGTFHKQAVSGLEVGTKRLFEIHPGDLLFSNVFAWEGAVAVATTNDAGRFGSHRFITCVTDPALASAEFLRFYFLTPEGLGKIRDASPGGAGRNRTLGIEKLSRIVVPLPSLSKQLAFTSLQAKVSALRVAQSKQREQLDQLRQRALEEAFG